MKSFKKLSVLILALTLLLSCTAVHAASSVTSHKLDRAYNNANLDTESTGEGNTTIYNQTNTRKTEIIGGKKSDNYALVFKSSNKNINDTYKYATVEATTNFPYDYSVTDGGQSVFEISFYAANRASRANAYAKLGDGTLVYVLDMRNATTQDGLIYVGKSGSKALDQWQAGRWYRQVLVIDNTTGLGTIYRNGEQLISGLDCGSSKEVTTMKLELSVNGIVADGNAIAIDDFKVYDGTYDPNDDKITITSSDTSSVTVDTENFTIKSKEDITCNKMIETLVPLRSGGIRIYTDSTYTEEAAGDAIMTSKMTVVAESVGGKTLGYYSYQNESAYAGITESVYDYSDESNTITLPAGLSVDEVLSNTTFSEGNTAEVYSEKNVKITGSAVLTAGCVVKVSSLSESKSYTVADDVVFKSDFENWNPDATYSKDLLNIPSWTTFYVNGRDKETATSVTAQAVSAAEKGGKVLKLYSKSTNPDQNSYGLYKDTLAGGKNLTVSTDIKGADITDLILTSKMIRTGETEESWLTFLEFKDGKIKGTDFVCDNKWYNLTVVFLPEQSRADYFVDGQKIGEKASSDFSKIEKFTQIRIEQKTTRDVERLVYFDDFKVIATNSEYTNYEMANSTTVLSDVFRIESGVRPSIVKAIGKTAEYVLENINLPYGAQADIYNGEEAVFATDVVSSGMKLTVISRDGKYKTDYKLEPEKIVVTGEASQIVEKYDNIYEGETLTAKATCEEEIAAPRLIAAYYYGNKLMSVDFVTTSVDAGNGYKELSASIKVESKNNTYVKVFLWDDMTNICDEKEIH